MRWLFAIIGIVVVVVTLGAIKGAQIGKLIGFGKQMEKDGPPPESVATAVADEQAWEGTLTSVGSVASSKGVALAADVPGVVTAIRFESGATVKQGAVLVELDSNVERSQLATAMARKQLANTTLARTRALAEKGAISPAQLDADDSSLRTSTTDVETIQAQIAKKTIRAPFGGKLGIRSVNLGQYLQPGTPIAVLETEENVKVDFTLPQQRLAEVKVGMPVRITLENAAEAGDSRDASVAPTLEGVIAAVDPTVDATTRTIKLRADVTDGDKLRPGMFVQVAVILPEKATSVTIPSTAVVHAPYGDSVFIVEEKKPDAPGLRTAADGKPVKIARQQFIRVGNARGDFVAINDGVKKGEEIVTAGAFKLRNNAPIIIEKSNQTSPQLAPRPENR